MTASLINALEQFQSRLLLTIHGVGEDDLRRPEGPGAWSIFDVIAHLGDLEMVTAVRLRMIVAGDQTPLPALQQNEWVAHTHRQESLAAVLESFWSARRQNLRFVARLHHEDLQRRGVHPRYGTVSVPDLLERLRDHQEKHLGQIERIKTTHRLAASDQPQLSGVVASSSATAPVRSPGDGITIRDLWREGVRRSLLVELAPGAQWPGLDYHVPGPEEVYVVSGDFDDGENVYTAGSFLHHPAGSSHSPRSAAGCVLLVYYPEG